MSAQQAEEKRSLEVAESARETEWQKPSFVKGLYMGNLMTELVFPFPEQRAEDRAEGDRLLARVRQFLVDKVDADKIDETKNIPRSVIEGLAELGLFGIKIAKEYGGLGMSQVNYNRIIELIASHCANTAVLLSAHQSIGVPQPLKMFGTREQKEAYLPRLAKGEISAFALTEPDVGSDPSSIATTATLTEDGEAYLINGKKLWISNGPIAGLLIVMTRTNDPKEAKPEITAFIVEGNSEGLSTEHRCDFMGLKGINNGLLNFNNVRVPKENIVLGLGRGLALALRTLNTGRLTLPAAGGGAMKQALAMATKWARERRQWGAPVGHHEAVAAKLASIAADIYAVESLTWLTSEMADRDVQDIRLEAAMAKLFCSEALWRSADAALQVRGGRGYETAQSLAGRGELPMPMERLLRDARINLIIEGTSEIMRLFIAREALDPHLRIAGASATSEKMDFAGAAKFYAKWYPMLWLPRLSTPGGVAVSGKLTRHLRFVERATRRLARDLFHMMVLHRQGLQKKQMVLGRLVDTGTELFTMSAVISRAASPRAERGAERLADLFCRQARRRIADQHRAVYCNDDTLTYRVAREVLDGAYPLLEDNILSTWKGESGTR
ncbi:acyl-CoA dehydrogenase/alkylation response protein AidB [Desulfuromonas soudanensis]|uniref:Acyl-CoA dehydrogenase/alkylation response protein AidB n=1 Tax=Desulfuromonas soudanensis TaxID=1603606 RepID=A0A0M5IYD0_9BACT|nr:acyl-CoA dehydrogenase family protein [Desulfuromonas soudanensis]ALC14994.1 acyl-CoA dehydrogenase/alkylation response protein AidB [Desulfuromonas soudanensis]